MSLFTDVRDFFVSPFEKSWEWVEDGVDWLAEQITPEVQTGISYTKPATDNPVVVIYGKRRVKGTVVWAALAEDTDGDSIKNDDLIQIIVWSEGVSNGVKSLLIDNVDATDPKFYANDDGSTRFVWANHFNDGWGRKTSYPQIGTVTTDYLDGNWAKNLGWDKSVHKLTETTCTELKLDWNGSNITGSEQIEAIIEGAIVWDPRTGGRVYTTNRFLIALDYLMSSRYGKGLSLSDINIDSFKAAADIADEEVEHYSGSGNRPRFTCNAIIDPSNSILDNFNRIMSEGFARGAIIDGKVTALVKGYGSIVDFEINEDNTYSFTESAKDQNDFYNRVTVKFPDEALDYKTNEVTFPEKDSELYNQWLAEDNLIVNDKDISLQTITNVYEALQYAEVIARESRENDTFDIECATEAFALEPGDIVPVYNTTTFWSGGYQRVLKTTLQKNGRVRLTTVKHTVYPWTPKSQQVVSPVPTFPDLTNPAAPNNIAIEFDNSGRNQAFVTWSSAFDNFFIRLTKNSELIVSGHISINSYLVSGLAAGDYALEVFSINKLGYRSKSSESIAFSISVPTNPVLSLKSATYNSLSITATMQSTIDSAGQFYWEVVNEIAPFVSGQNVVFTGLSANTDYTVRCKYRNLAGESEWVENVFTTADNVDDIIDIISETGLPQTALNQQTQDLISQLDRETPNNIHSAIENAENNINTVKLNSYQQQQKAGEELLLLAADYGRYQKIKSEQDRDFWRYIGALSYVDDETGQIVNRAYEYSDTKFSEASSLIDGVNTSINFQTKRITDLDEKVVSQSAQIELNKSAINLRATYAEVQNEVTRAIESIQPAYSWQFNTSVDGWAANNGTVTATAEAIQLTFGDISISGISFAADENPILTIRFKRTGGSGHAGTIKTNGTTLTPVIADVPNDSNWYVKTIDLSADDNYTGTITSAQLILGTSAADTFDIDYIIIGKRSDQLIELESLQARVTAAEQTLDPENGRWSNYVTTTWFNNNAIKTADVRNEINSFDAEFSITATLEALDENDVINKANSAKQWINAADTNITSVVTNYLASEGGVNEQLTQVQSEIDAQNGIVRDQSLAIQHTNNNAQQAELALFNQSIQQFNEFKNNLAQYKRLALSIAQLESKVDDSGAIAQQLVQLAANFDKNSAYLNALSKAFSNTNQATASEFKQLRVEQNEADSKVLSEANAYTKATIGYCVDQNGQPTSHETAAACITAGNEWVESPLSEAMNNLVLQADGAMAKLSQIAQLFKNVDGNLIARGGLVLDNNGKISGTVSTNNGEISTNDFIADFHRVGIYNSDNEFVPLFYLDLSDPNDPQLVFRGRAEFGGYTVSSESDIRALDGEKGDKGDKGDQGIPGQDGVDGQNVTVTDNGNGTYTVTGANGSVIVSDGSDAPIPTVQNNGDGTYSITVNGQTVVWSDGTDGHDGADGQDGHTPQLGIDYFYNGRFYTSIFKTSASQPSTPTGGSFNGTTETVPSGWSDSPVYTNGLITWVSRAIYTQNPTTGAWTHSAWSQPKEYVIKGDQGIPGQDGVDGQPGADGQNGVRGAGRYEVGTSTGDWVNGTAINAVPNNEPVNGDVVKIFKSSDKKIQTTRIYQSGIWSNFASTIHGDELVEGTVVADAIRAGAVSAEQIDGDTNQILSIDLNKDFETSYTTGNTYPLAPAPSVSVVSFTLNSSIVDRQVFFPRLKFIRVDTSNAEMFFLSKVEVRRSSNNALLSSDSTLNTTSSWFLGDQNPHGGTDFIFTADELSVFVAKNETVNVTLSIRVMGNIANTYFEAQLTEQLIRVITQKAVSNWYTNVTIH